MIRALGREKEISQLEKATADSFGYAQDQLFDCVAHKIGERLRSG
jgi:hypothetical protein